MRVPSTGFRTLPHNAHAPTPSLPAAATDALQALRQATAGQHARLDASLPVGREGATLADYAAHTHMVAAWLQALWPLLLHLQTREAGFRFAPTERLAALRQDLEQARAQPWPEPSTTTLQCLDQALARHPNQADAVHWGMAYVVEGSQLGGQVLYRRLAPHLAPHPLRYLQGDGAGTGTRWKSFMALLRAHLVSAAAVAAACDGARAAFQGLQAHVDASEGTPA